MTSAITPGPAERLVTAALAAGSIGDPSLSTAPHFVLSPTTPTGERTQGFALCVSAPASSPATGPFSITPYRRIPSLGVWAKGATFTDAAYLDALVCYDVGAGVELFFDVSGTADGGIVLALAEL